MLSAFDALYNFSDDAKLPVFARDSCQITISRSMLSQLTRGTRPDACIDQRSQAMYHPISSRFARVCGLSKVLTALAHWKANPTFVDEATMLIANAVADPGNAVALLEQDYLAMVLSLLDAPQRESILEQF